VRAAGGLWLGTNSSVSISAGQFIATSTGAYLSTGGTWTNNSDRNLKQHLTAVDGQSVLQRLADVPMFTWAYKVQPGSVRHIGPMAQDFHKAFAVGEDDRHISTVDAESVALAAIQELYRDSLAKDAKIARLTAELEKLEAVERKVNGLAARLNQVENGSAPLQQSEAIGTRQLTTVGNKPLFHGVSSGRPVSQDYNDRRRWRVHQTNGLVRYRHTE
jgi:Chaperone of endosialidase